MSIRFLLYLKLFQVKKEINYCQYYLLLEIILSPMQFEFILHLKLFQVKEINKI